MGILSLINSWRALLLISVSSLFINSKHTFIKVIGMVIFSIGLFLLIMDGLVDPHYYPKIYPR